MVVIKVVNRASYRGADRVLVDGADVSARSVEGPLERLPPYSRFVPGVHRILRPLTVDGQFRAVVV